MRSVVLLGCAVLLTACKADREPDRPWLLGDCESRCERLALAEAMSSGEYRFLCVAEACPAGYSCAVYSGYPDFVGYPVFRGSCQLECVDDGDCPFWPPMALSSAVRCVQPRYTEKPGLRYCDYDPAAPGPL